jgi:DNA repair exonuclease SbcCD ATPase subunit
MKNLIIILTLIIHFEAFSQKENNQTYIDSQKVLIEKLKKIAKEHPDKINQINNSTNDYSELGNGSGKTASFPEEYEEMAQAKGLNPFSMPNKDTLDEMQSEYEKEKIIQWLLIITGICCVLFTIKYIKRRIILSKKSQER